MSHLPKCRFRNACHGGLEREKVKEIKKHQDFLFVTCIALKKVSKEWPDTGWTQNIRLWNWEKVYKSQREGQMDILWSLSFRVQFWHWSVHHWCLYCWVWTSIGCICPIVVLLILEILFLQFCFMWGLSLTTNGKKKKHRVVLLKKTVQVTGSSKLY